MVGKIFISHQDYRAFQGFADETSVSVERFLKLESSVLEDIGLILNVH